MGKNKKQRGGLVYSTDPGFIPDSVERFEEGEHGETPPPEKQALRLRFEKKHRAGKQVTIISGFAGREEDLDSLGKMLRKKCGVGGSVKNGEILLQGDLRVKAAELLRGAGYRVTGG